jgi:predicted RNase H-like nuclease (RuvC/YqgF family)
LRPTNLPARSFERRCSQESSALNRQRRVVDDIPSEDDLKDCHEKVEQLREDKKKLEVENEQLRESADTFGGLAERLNKKVKKEPAD